MPRFPKSNFAGGNTQSTSRLSHGVGDGCGNPDGIDCETGYTDSDEDASGCGCIDFMIDGTGFGGSGDREDSTGLRLGYGFAPGGGLIDGHGIDHIVISQWGSKL